ncbi:hypothetical protein [Streptomyces candidus]|uniref:Uncharacterized protein n=1 Tax=Streptomyces candidus TaxID=67283 RepID=A0A7X0HFW7_9ACTN|nr:hypothetical protein [Streptomyces candidus]MBB6435754.1 hypothetical protein [Streptomyces candidus]
MKITFTNDGSDRLNVLFEPAGMEHDIPPGDHIVVDWPVPENEALEGSIDHTPPGLVLMPPSYLPLPSWDSAGKELDV